MASGLAFVFPRAHLALSDQCHRKERCRRVCLSGTGNTYFPVSGDFPVPVAPGMGGIPHHTALLRIGKLSERAFAKT